MASLTKTLKTMRTTIICIVGLPGSGKSTASSVLEDLYVPTISMGDIVREKASSSSDNNYSDKSPEDFSDNSEVTSDSIGEWINYVRNKHGNHIVAKWTLDKITNKNHKIVAIEGVRSPEEVELFAENSDDMFIFHITAPFDVRFERLKNRGRNLDHNFSKQDLEKRDEREKSWGLNDVVNEYETHKIEHNSSIENFRRKLLENITQILED